MLGLLHEVLLLVGIGLVSVFYQNFVLNDFELLLFFSLLLHHQLLGLQLLLDLHLL